MNTASSSLRLGSAEAKLSRAHEHLEAIAVAVRDYLASTPYVISTRREPATARLTYFMASVKPTPVRISAMIGDAIHNLRSALDHVAYQLVWVSLGKQPSGHVYFPIADNRGTYEIQRCRQLKGARPAAIAAVDAVKPYRGGNDLLWQLHKLNNVDKHRVLLTSGSAYQSVNIGPRMTRQMQELMATMPGEGNKTEFPAMNLFLRPANRLFPLKAGDALFTDLPNAELDPKLQFQFSLSFGERDIVFGEPIVETIASMLKCIESILPSFGVHLQ